MPNPPRWITDTEPGQSQWYIERFQNMATQGVDLTGEARLVDAMVAPGARILDAGCGPGRVGADSTHVATLSSAWMSTPS